MMDCNLADILNSRDNDAVLAWDYAIEGEDLSTLVTEDTPYDY